jgi:hypothetical protein
LLPERPWCPVSLLEYPTTFLEACSEIRDGVFTFLLLGLSISGLSGPVDLMEGLASPGTPESKSQLHKEKAQELIGSPAHQTGKNPGSNNRPAFGRQKGSLITS